MSSGPSVEDPKELNESDLLVHGSFTLTLFGNETAWVGNVAGTRERPILLLGLKHVWILGEADAVLDRLRALVRVAEDAVNRPGDWDLLLPRLPRGTRRTWPHPFSDDPRTAPRADVSDRSDDNEGDSVP